MTAKPQPVTLPAAAAAPATIAAATPEGVSHCASLPAPRIALLGYGAMGQFLLPRLASLLPGATWAVVVRPERSGLAPEPGRPTPPVVLSSPAQVLAWRPRLVIECAGHAAVRQYAPALLRGGCDVIVVSVGALADSGLHQHVRDSARAGGGRLRTVAGAMGGLDALAAAQWAGLHSVRYVGTKPPAAWRGTPAAQAHDLAALTSPTVVFEGSARKAALAYPQNANVTAAVALAGVGFDATQVRLVADPAATQNGHALEVAGAFGTFVIQLANQPFPQAPKTSWLAALSIVQEVADYFHLDA